MTGPLFVAYVYPGWHPDPYRPGVDEWRLLDRFVPAFPGHVRPAEPAAGRYDDADPAVAARHVAQAAAAGVGGLTYFLYWTGTELVLDAPLEAVRDVAEATGDVMVACTWCVRLPHATFPVDRADAALVRDTTAPTGDLEDRAIDDLTVAELQRLVPEWDDSWLDLPALPVRRTAGATVAGASLGATQVGPSDGAPDR